MKEKLGNKDYEILMDIDFLVSVVVAIGEVADITGVPQRKIRYWDEKGLIVPVDKDATYRKYDYVNIKKIVLIQELLDEGYTLEAAAKKVNERFIHVAEVFKRILTSKSKSHPEN